MLRLNHLLFLVAACCIRLSGTAQTANCSADFSYSVENNNAVVFFAKDSLGASQQWLFGDGTPAVVSSNGMLTHLYAKPGKYEVRHIIEKPGLKCRDSLVKAITVEWLDQCKAAFYFQKDSGALSGHFFNNSISYTGIKKVYWNFGDGSISDGLNPVHHFAKPGTYNVCLKIETNNGCTSDHCETLQLIDSVGSCTMFTQFKHVSDTLDCKKVYFQNTSGLISSNVHFIWKFGDGATSQDINPVHMYTQSGKYYVCLVSEAGTNCRKEYCDSVTVNCEISCNITARFEWKKDSGDCKKIRFISVPSSATANVHYEWKFGDGDGSYDASPVYIYKAPGLYTVCLVVDAGNNCKKYYCDSVTVRCEDTCNFKPSFTWKSEANMPGKIYFSNGATDSSAAIHYAWNFGDGAVSKDANPVHAYAQPGKYTVCLVAETNRCRKEICLQIEIKTCNIIARFEKRQDSVKWNTVYFSNVSKPVNNTLQTYWTYGDGTASRDYNSVHTYDKQGVYNVCLKVISLNGCISEYCDTVKIVRKDSCAANAGFNRYNGSASALSIKFEGLYQSNAALFTWNFGDSTAGTGRIAYHVYKKPGKYMACLTVTDKQCLNTQCRDFIIEKSADSARLAIFPNPAVNAVFIELILQNAGQLSIRLLDGSGAVRAVFSRNGIAGSNRYSLPVDMLNQGLYLIEIKSDRGVVWYRRFVKG